MTEAVIGFCGWHLHDLETVKIIYTTLPQARQQRYATNVAAVIT